jgi:hypothetical protein
LLAEFRAIHEVADECGFVLPAVAFFQDEHPEESGHLVACRSHISVVGAEPEVGQRENTDELLDGVVALVIEPRLRDCPDI